MPIVKYEILYRWEELPAQVRDEIERRPCTWYTADGEIARESREPDWMFAEGYYEAQAAADHIQDECRRVNDVIYRGDWALDVTQNTLYGVSRVAVELPDGPVASLLAVLMVQVRPTPAERLIKQLPTLQGDLTDLSQTVARANEILAGYAGYGHMDFITFDRDLGYALSI